MVAKKFIITIGDEGAILSLIQAKRVEKRLFAASTEEKDRGEFDKILSSNKKIPVYMLIDTMEQSYAKQILPAVSFLTVTKLVQKRLDKDFASSDIKGAIAMGRITTGRRDWIFMFASTPMSKIVSSWLEYLIALPNHFMGIYMLPVEMEKFAENLNKLLAKTEEKPTKKINKSVKKEKKLSTWQLITTHNKTGGFRQIVLFEDKIIFTRLVKLQEESNLEIVAGNIEQETVNTLDYLRRLNFVDQDKINIIFIVGGDLKVSFGDPVIRGEKLQIYTPEEIANLFKFENAAKKEDKFADVILSCNFANSKQILKLYNPTTRKLYNYSFFLKLMSILMSLYLLVFVCYSGILSYNFIKYHRGLNKGQADKIRIEKEWKEALSSGKYNVDDANKIIDAATLHKKILSVRTEPLDFIDKLTESTKLNATINSFNWKINLGIKNHPIDAIVNLNFYNTGSNIEELLNNFDKFSKKIVASFPDNIVDHTKLPEKINFEESKKVIPIQVTVKEKVVKKTR